MVVKPKIENRKKFSTLFGDAHDFLYARNAGEGFRPAQGEPDLQEGNADGIDDDFAYEQGDQVTLRVGTLSSMPSTVT